MTRRQDTQFEGKGRLPSMAGSLAVWLPAQALWLTALALWLCPGPVRAGVGDAKPQAKGPGKTLSKGAFAPSDGALIEPKRLNTPSRRAISIPPFWIDRVRGQTRSQFLLLPPLYFRSEDKLSGSKAQLVGPVFWSKSPTQRAVHTPLASVVQGQSRKLWALWPLMTAFSKRPQGSDSVLLAGLYWQRARKAQQTHHWGLGPLFWSFSRKDQRSMWLPPLLSGVAWGPKRQLQMLTPLAWHSRQASGQHRAMLGPLFAAWGGSVRNLSLAPLWFHRRGTKLDFTLVPPLLTGYRHDLRKNTKTLFTPLFVRHQGPSSSTLGVAGLYWQHRHNQRMRQGLFPVFYRYQSPSSSGLITPVGASWRKKDTRRFLWGPVFGEQSPGSSTTGLFPLWARHKSAKTSVQLLAPLWLSVRSPSRDLDLWTPLVWRNRQRGKIQQRSWAVMPLYFAKRQPQGVNIDAGPGFYWSRNQRRRTHTLIAGPFFHRLSRKALHTGIFPISWWRDDVDKRHFVLLPLVFHNKDKRAQTHSTIALPFWFDRQRAPNNRTWLAFPFVLGREGPNRFVRVGLGAPGVIDTFSLRKNRRLTGWLPFYFRYQSCGFQLEDPEDCRYTARGTFPLWYYGKNLRGDRLAHGALGLYYYQKRGARKTLLTLLAGVDTEPGKRFTWYAGPVFRKVTNDTISHGIVPLYLHSKKRLTDKQTTLVLPPLFISQHREDRRWFEVGLLAWHFRSQHQVSTLLLPPLIGHQHTYAERKRTWVLPLFWDDHRMGKGSRFTAIFPLLWFRGRNRSGTSSVLFPVWWDFQRGEDRRTRLFLPPLWIDVKRSEHHRTRMIPGLWYHRDRRRDDTTVLGPGLLWWTARQDPDPDDEIDADRDWRALFGFFGGGRKLGRPYMSLFGQRVWLRRAAKPKAPPEDPGQGVNVQKAPKPATP